MGKHYILWVLSFFYGVFWTCFVDITIDLRYHKTSYVILCKLFFDPDVIFCILWSECLIGKIVQMIVQSDFLAVV